MEDLGTFVTGTFFVDHGPHRHYAQKFAQKFLLSPEELEQFMLSFDSPLDFIASEMAHAELEKYEKKAKHSASASYQVKRGKDKTIHQIIGFDGDSVNDSNERIFELRCFSILNPERNDTFYFLANQYINQRYGGKFPNPPVTFLVHSPNIGPCGDFLGNHYAMGSSPLNQMKLIAEEIGRLDERIDPNDLSFLSKLDYAKFHNVGEIRNDEIKKQLMKDIEKMYMSKMDEIYEKLNER